MAGVMELPKGFPLRYESFIGGRLHRSSQNERIDVLSPINGKNLYDIPQAGQVEIGEAMNCAEKSFKKWSLCSVTTRANILDKIADIIKRNVKLLAQIEVYDTGKLFSNAINEIDLASQYFKYFAACIVTQEGSVAQVEDVLSFNLYESLGRVGIILPWNFPLLMFCWKVAPALAAGNVVIVKPSEFASLSILKLMELITPIIPKGIINVLLGCGVSTGMQMLEHDGFDKFSFTGGVETGKKVMKAVSNHLTPVSLELGGKSPCVVTADVMRHGEQFLDRLIQTITSFTYNQGQICGNLSRLLIDCSIADFILEKIKLKLSQFSIGDPRVQINMMGPVISQERHNFITQKISEAKASGAIITSFDNSFNLSKDCEQGYYLSPYLVEGNHSMEIFQEEIFGPVLCIDTFKTLEEAVVLSNCTQYGLTASIWSRDIKEINYLAKNIVAGKIWVNTSHIYYPHTKFGGMKKSGHANDMHKLALNEYQKIKNIIQYY